MRWASSTLAARARVLQRALDHGAGKRAAVRGAGVNVLLRIDSNGGDFGRPRHRRLIDDAAVELRLNVAEAARPVADPDDTDVGVARPARAVLVVEHGGPGHCEIAAPPREFLKAPAALR